MTVTRSGFTAKPAHYLRKPSFLYRYVFVEVNSAHLGTGFNPDLSQSDNRCNTYEPVFRNSSKA
jgi:hypothetical protein